MGQALWRWRGCIKRLLQASRLKRGRKCSDLQEADKQPDSMQSQLIIGFPRAAAELHVMVRVLVKDACNGKLIRPMLHVYCSN